MSYYQTFVERYPDDLDRSIWASYEIAFLHHKMGNDKKALELPDALIERYQNKPQGVEYPSGPLVLTRKVRDNIMVDLEVEKTPVSAE